MFFVPSFPGCGVYPLVVDNFCVLGPGLGWLRCVTAIMSRGRELSGSWLPGTHQPVKVSQPLSSQLILGATGDWGWLWADIWPLSPLHVMCHVSCHILRCSPHAAGLRHCFLFFPRPGPGNSGLVSDLSASRGAAGAAHCLQADEAGDQGEECLGPRALRKWQARVGARAMIPGDNGSYQRMSWSDDGLITLTMLIDWG